MRAHSGVNRLGERFRQTRWTVGLLALLAGAYGWGRYGSEPSAAAQQPPAKLPPMAGQPLPLPPQSEAANRWVAVIHGNIPITREEFGEYLIARHGDTLELFVNKRIIEHACRQRGIEVTDTEVEAALTEELKQMQVSLKDFVEKILKKYEKSLFEWKEDVIRPRLAMTKMCKDRIQVTDEDFRNGFEAYYGEKVDCRLIVYPPGEEKFALNQYADLRKSDEEFDRISKQQASATLAATGGRITPIGRHTTGNDELEKEAFSLKPGEISRLIGTPEGTVVIKCVGRVPPNTTKTLDGERARLEKEIREKKIALEIPKLFKEISDQAQAKLFIKKQKTQFEMGREVARELQGPVVPAGGVVPKPSNK
jgi:hypothetical protein